MPTRALFHDALVRANPERLLWGTDWPHPQIAATVMADDGHLVDLFKNGRRTRVTASASWSIRLRACSASDAVQVYCCTITLVPTGDALVEIGDVRVDQPEAAGRHRGADGIGPLVPWMR